MMNKLPQTVTSQQLSPQQLAYLQGMTTATQQQLPAQNTHTMSMRMMTPLALVQTQTQTQLRRVAVTLMLPSLGSNWLAAAGAWLSLWASSWTAWTCWTRISYTSRFCTSRVNGALDARSSLSQRLDQRKPCTVVAAFPLGNSAMCCLHLCRPVSSKRCHVA